MTVCHFQAPASRPSLTNCQEKPSNALPRTSAAGNSPMELPAGWPESSEDWPPLAKARKPNASCVTRPSKVSQCRRFDPPVTRRVHSHEVDSSFRVYAQNSSDSLVRHSDSSL
jgi:hypothetical protein